MSLFPTEQDEIVSRINELFPGQSEVDIDDLCAVFPRLALVRQLAEQNRFMHWELEFADLFAEKGGFDLVIGNPPWIKVTWNEQGVLSDKQPMFAVKKLSATETTKFRNDALQQSGVKELYFSEYESMSGEQAFLNASQNYCDLKGQQTNLFKCFLPQAWMFNSEPGVSAFVHPEGVYDDPKGGPLREKLYARLRKHFMFANERRLFPEVDHHTTFSLNVYGGPLQTVSFDTISNLYDAGSIAECYEGDSSLPIPGMKDIEGNWNTQGHPDRLLRITKKELGVFARLFDDSNDWKSAKLPALYTKQMVAVLTKFLDAPMKLGNYGKDLLTTLMWDETNAQNDGTIVRNVHFPVELSDVIYSGPHVGVANPLFKSSRRVCRLNSDYDNIDLTNIPAGYMQRVNYSPLCEPIDYWGRVSKTSNGELTTQHYRLILRKMLNITGERTLIGAVVPPKTAHTNGLIGIDVSDKRELMIVAGLFASVPFDFLVKVTGKSNFTDDTARMMPVLKTVYDNEVVVRAILLNCLTNKYEYLWKGCFDIDFSHCRWSKNDLRLINSVFSEINSEWTSTSALRSDYERHQALIELDVLASMALGMNLKQLKTIYQIQFPVLKSYEDDTWYDAKGRITFTNNRSMTGVGFSRAEWENPGAVQPVQKGSEPWDGIMKNATAGYVFARTVTDDTMPGGPVERTIEYVAPFDRCDREQDYETAWKFFEDKYGKPE